MGADIRAAEGKLRFCGPHPPPPMASPLNSAHIERFDHQYGAGLAGEREPGLPAHETPMRGWQPFERPAYDRRGQRPRPHYNHRRQHARGCSCMFRQGPSTNYRKASPRPSAGCKLRAARQALEIVADKDWRCRVAVVG